MPDWNEEIRRHLADLKLAPRARGGDRGGIVPARRGSLRRTQNRRGCGSRSAPHRARRVDRPSTARHRTTSCRTHQCAGACRPGRAWRKQASPVGRHPGPSLRVPHADDVASVTHGSVCRVGHRHAPSLRDVVPDADPVGVVRCSQPRELPPHSAWRNYTPTPNQPFAEPLCPRGRTPPTSLSSKQNSRSRYPGRRSVQSYVLRRQCPTLIGFGPSRS